MVFKQHSHGIGPCLCLCLGFTWLLEGWEEQGRGAEEGLCAG